MPMSQIVEPELAEGVFLFLCLPRDVLDEPPECTRHRPIWLSLMVPEQPGTAEGHGQGLEDFVVAPPLQVDHPDVVALAPDEELPSVMVQLGTLCAGEFVLPAAGQPGGVYHRREHPWSGIDDPADVLSGWQHDRVAAFLDAGHAGQDRIVVAPSLVDCETDNAGEGN